MHAGLRLDKLRGDAHTLAGLAHAPLQHIAHAKLAADLLHIDRASLVGEARIARDDEEPADPRQCCGDLLHHAVGKVVLLRIAAQIGERQNGERGPVQPRSQPRRRQPSHRRWRRTLGEPVANAGHRHDQPRVFGSPSILRRSRPTSTSMLRSNASASRPATA